MARRVEYSHRAAKTLARMDRATSRRIRAKVEQLARDPAALANNVKALAGVGNLMRLRVGDWRVIYTQSLVVVSVVKVSPRGSAHD